MGLRAGGRGAAFYMAAPRAGSLERGSLPTGPGAPLGQRPGPRLLIAGTSAREILAHRRCRPRPALHLDLAAVPPPGQLAEPGDSQLLVRQPDPGDDERLRERTRSLRAVLSSCRLSVH